MIKVNETGWNAIRAYLLENHKKGASLSDENINAWATDAEKDDRAQFELRSFEAVSGHTELFDLPSDGFDLEMTLEEFGTWADSVKWTSVENGEFGDGAVADGYDDEGNPIEKSQGFGNIWRTNTATHTSGKVITITYEEEVSWIGTENARYTDDYETSPTNNSDTWTVEGVTLVDEDGDEESKRVIESWLDERNCFVEMKSIDVESLIPAVTVEKIDEPQGDADMEEIEIENDDAPNIRFRGEKLATATNNDAYNKLSRWTVMKLWKTQGGMYICQIIGHTIWQGEVDRYKVKVCTTPAEVIAFFGHGGIAKEIYSEAGIDATLKVD